MRYITRAVRNFYICAPDYNINGYFIASLLLALFFCVQPAAEEEEED